MSGSFAAIITGTLDFFNNFYYGTYSASVFVACDAIDFVKKKQVAFALSVVKVSRPDRMWQV